VLNGGLKVPKKISGDMILLDVLRKYPGTRKVIDRYGMGCRGCMGAAAETVRQSAMTHGIEPEGFIREMNEAAGREQPAGARR
jgi:hybrid cluster-associated redox disulfide protein